MKDRKTDEIIESSNDIEDNDPEDIDNSDNLAIGICLGMCIGGSLGYVLFKNFSIGMCIGLSIGIAIGTTLDSSKKKN
ncbi:hypothetical protein [Clostridium niameyense]|uniref:hypothetical protein n=1 Tax=Clostridium niameyense TaxID=1622073 RepID=UPI00067EDA55|nr:hypothetical protein [Clostridium niameyense]